VRKSYTILAVIVAATMLMPACTPRDAVKPAIISVTIRPVALIVQAVAGSAMEVRVLADADGNPVQNAQELASGSAVVFQAGTSIDRWSSGIVPKGVQLVTVCTVSDANAPGDPWLSLQFAGGFARLVRDTLDTMYPGLQDKFDSQYAVFMNQCSQADGQLKKLVWKAQTRTFLAEDATWSRAAGDFGLRVVVQPGLKGMDLATSEAAVQVREWGSAAKTMVVVRNVGAGETTGVDRQNNGIVVCRLDASGSTAQGDFVSWLDHQLELLGSAIGS